MKEWENLKSLDEMIKICQVPVDILDKISTQGLVETCLDFPLLRSILAFNSLQTGIENRMENFNGFDELITREDAAVKLLHYYKVLDPNNLPKNDDDLSILNFALQFINISLIQSQEIFIQQLNTTDRRALVKEAISKCEQFQADQINYLFSNVETSALIMARVMQASGYQPFLEELSKNESINTFEEKAYHTHLETINTILNYARNFTS